MAILRKKSVDVLRHLKKIVDDLDQISTLEQADILANQMKIEELQAKNKEHRIEADLSAKVAKNIRELIGE